MEPILTQIEAAIPQLISSIIIAALTWLARKIIDWFKRQSKPTAQPTSVASAGGAIYAQAPSSLNWGQALLQAGILQLVVNAESFILAIIIRVVSDPKSYQNTFVLAQLIVGTLTAIIVFALYASRTPREMLWRRLALVALFAGLLTPLVNFLFALFVAPTQALTVLSPATFLAALIQSYVAMGIGGLIGDRLRPATPLPVAAAPQRPLYATPTIFPPQAPPFQPNIPQRPQPAPHPHASAPTPWPGASASPPQQPHQP